MNEVEISILFYSLREAHWEGFIDADGFQAYFNLIAMLRKMAVI